MSNLVRSTKELPIGAIKRQDGQVMIHGHGSIISVPESLWIAIAEEIRGGK